MTGILWRRIPESYGEQTPWTVVGLAGPQSSYLCGWRNGQREEGMPRRNDLLDHPKVTMLRVSVQSTALLTELDIIWKLQREDRNWTMCDFLKNKNVFQGTKDSLFFLSFVTEELNQIKRTTKMYPDYKKASIQSSANQSFKYRQERSWWERDSLQTWSMNWTPLCRVESSQYQQLYEELASYLSSPEQSALHWMAFAVPKHSSTRQMEQAW